MQSSLWRLSGFGGCLPWIFYGKIQKQAVKALGGYIKDIKSGRMKEFVPWEAGEDRKKLQ